MSYSYARVGDIRPVEQRHAQIAAALSRLGGKAIHPISEEACDLMAAEIERIEKLNAPLPVDPAFRAAMDEFRNHVERYTQLHSTIVERQKRLKLRPRLPEHDIVDDVSADVLQEPVSPRGMITGAFGGQPTEVGGGLRLPRFASVAEAKEGTRRVIAAIHGIEMLADRLAKVSEFDNSPLEDRNRRLILSLFARIGVLEQRILELEGADKRRVRA